MKALRLHCGENKVLNERKASCYLHSAEQRALTEDVENRISRKWVFIVDIPHPRHFPIYLTAALG